MKSPLEELVTLAAEHRPDTASMEYGFETRFFARLRSEVSPVTDPVTAFLGQFSKALWRSAAGLSPVLTGVAIWFFLSMDTSLASASSGLANAFHELRSLVELPSVLF